MKKSILVVLCTLLSSVAFAQNEIYWNVKAGMNISNFTSGADTKAKIGFRAGVGMEYDFDEMWSLQPSLLFTTKGTKIDGNLLDQTINAMYLELPIMAGLRFMVGDRSSILITAGPYIAYGIAGKTTIKLDGAREEKVNTFGDGRAKRFDVGLGVGVAYEFGPMFVSADGQFGLTKVMDYGNSSPKNLNFAIGLGYKF